MIVVARVADLAEQIRGVTYDKEDVSSVPRPGYLPVLRAGNISENGLVFDDLVFVPVERIAARQMLRQNDVVIAASSGSLDVVGKAARSVDNYEGGFGAFCKVLRPGPKVDPAYFAHFFRTPDYRRRISRLAAGVNINNLRNEHINEIPIPLPPLPEQRRIAAILDQADALRAKRRAALAQLDVLTQSIFLEMFGDPVENRRQFPVCRMIELVDAGRPISYGILMPGPDQPVGVKYVRVVDMRDGGIELSGIRKTTEAISKAFRRSLLKAGDLLMSIRGHVGRFAVVPPELNGANITQDTARLAIVGADPVFVRECLRTEGFQRWMAKHTKGVAVRGINLGDVKLMPIIMPDVGEQREFARRARAADELKMFQRAALTELDSLFASLQHRAFRGEL